MARPVTHEVDVSIGLEKADELNNAQIEIRDSEEQSLREDRREAILAAREAHKKIFDKVFDLDPAARAKNSKNPDDITYYARFHSLDVHGRVGAGKLQPNDDRASIGIIGATVAIKKLPELHLGVDIRQEQLEQRLVVAAAIKGLKSPALDIEEGDWHILDGLYVPREHTMTFDQFNQELYETWEHRKGNVMTADLGLDSDDYPRSFRANVQEALAVISALTQATQSRSSSEPQ